jgi:short subunit dehydrogenase-like uncharacterized protein
MKIAVYGASGYQGKLVARELVRRDIDMVLVGRSAERLREAAGESGAPDTERRVAALDDQAALAAALAGCGTVINCAGPFTPTGEAVVRAAIAAGCSYVDTAGEQLYIKRIFDTFGPDAGITIVPATTDGGVPGDLIAHLLAERIGPLNEITAAHAIAGGVSMSRGSLRSLLETLDTIKSGGLIYEDGDWHADTAARHTSIIFPGDPEATPVMKFALQEVITVPRHVNVRRVEAVADAALGTRFAAISPELLDSLPEGPPEEDRRAQRFTIVVDAIGSDGRSARGVVRGPDAYGTTAVIAVEAARRLASGRTVPGVLAPAQAFDPASFLDFLARHGVTCDIEVHDTQSAPS